MEKKNEYYCDKCKKNYKNYKSLWKHKYVYHQEKSSTNVVVQVKNVALLEKEVNIDDNRMCNYCDKILCDRKYRWKHEKICKIRILNEEKQLKENEELKETVKQLVKANEKIAKDYEEIKENMKKANKKIINNINNGNINNGNIINNHNHIQINAIGCEDLIKKLSDTQQLDVLTAGLFDESPIVELVRKTYNDEKLKKNRNTYISNLQSPNCLTYNNEKKRFDAVNKNKHIDNIIKNRMDDIIKMYAAHGNKMKPAHKKIFNEYIENINNNDSIKNKELYQKHKEEINYIIYNDKEFMKKVKEIVDKTEIKEEDSEDEEIEDEDSEDSVVL
jgi:hypothetical protein